MASQIPMLFLMLLLLAVVRGDTKAGETATAQCLVPLFEEPVHRIVVSAQTSVGSTGNLTMGASVASFGCYSVAPSHEALLLNISGLVASHPASSWADLCAASCLSALSEDQTRLQVAIIAVLVPQSPVMNASCMCYDSTSRVTENSSTLNNSCCEGRNISEISASACPSAASLFRVDTYCPVKGDCGAGCRSANDGACCAPIPGRAPSGSSEMPLATIIVLSVAGLIGLLIVVETTIQAVLFVRRMPNAATNQDGVPLLPGMLPARNRVIEAPQTERQILNGNAMKLRNEDETASLAMALMFGVRNEGTCGYKLNPQVNDPVNDVCCICLEVFHFQHGDGASLLPCNHRFHFECLKQYIHHQLRRFAELSCPICRKSILQGSKEEEEESAPAVPPVAAHPQRPSIAEDEEDLL